MPELEKKPTGLQAVAMRILAESKEKAKDKDAKKDDDKEDKDEDEGSDASSSKSDDSETKDDDDNVKEETVAEEEVVEEEELDELSKQTLSVYTMKAGKDRFKKSSIYGTSPEGQKHFDKRQKGSQLAMDKVMGKAKVNAKEETEMTDQVEDKVVEEETNAASSLHPKARPSEPMSKIGAMQSLLGMMNGMSKSDALEFFAKVQAQWGPGKDWGVGDKSGSNQSTVDMKASKAVASKGPKTKDGMPTLDAKNNPLATGAGLKFSVKEDVEAMFDGQELSEDFKDKASTLFEAAVEARVITETTRLEEEFEAKLEEEIATFSEEVTSKLDSYLDYVVENWMKENTVAIESTLRNELMDEFIDGLKNLFTEHYISVPQEKVDVLEALAEKVEELEGKLDETISENTELKGMLAEGEKKAVFEDLASDLALTQQEKFAALAEGIEFNGDLDTYAKKLKIVKENYFKTEKAPASTNLEEETFEGDTVDTATTKSVDPMINRYVQAIARTTK